MSDLLNFATIAFVSLVQASLQLSLGGLLLLMHSSLEKHPRRKTHTLVNFYIFGSSLMLIITVAACAFFIERIFGGSLPVFAQLIIVGVLIASALIMLFLYYRRGTGTELWLPRSFARFLGRSAKLANNGVASFSLGLLSSFAEIPMNLALCFATANALLKFSPSFQLFALFCYTLFCGAPLLVAKFRIRSGKSVFDIQKRRLKNKTFSRLTSCGSFLILAVFILAFWVSL